MSLLLVIIAIPGIAAVLLRWSAALFETVRHSAERFVAKEIAATRAARGDISGLSEADNYRQSSRSKQLRGALRLALWSAALVVPLLLPATFLIYAFYGLLWLVPIRRRPGDVS